MINRQHRFNKSSLAIGIATLLGASSPTLGANWDFGDVSVSLDSTFTLATSVRVEDRDFDLIGNSNHPQFDWSGYNAATNVKYQSADVWALSDGNYSSNGDLGNLSHDPGKAFSTQIAGNHDLDINFGDYGFFTRAFWFYDFEQSGEEHAAVNPITGHAQDLCASSGAEELLCKDFRILDAYFYGDFWIDDKPLSIRIGDQVISWGESTFIQHGINTTNPVDVNRARAPGAELKEVFIPVGMVYASLGLTDTVSVSAYYQYEWERSWLPVAGSYFATNDFVGEGGQANNIQLGFTGNPDIDLEFLLSSLNGLGDALRAGGDQTALAQAYLAYPTKVALRGYSDNAHEDADDQGQYGVRVTWLAEMLYDSELSFYHINYHSQRPLISGITSDFTATGIGTDLAYLAQNTITKDNVTNLDAFTEARFYYPEDIQLFGMSFNTNIGSWALAGEFAYRVDEPLQIDDVELLYMGMPEQLANVGISPELGGISQLNNIDRAVGPGETAQGFVFSDTYQAQFTLSQVFGPALGTDNLIVLGEVGYVNIVDFPDPSVVRLNAPGTGRTASLEPTADGNPRTGLHTALSNGPETNPFATDDAWGYRILALADFNNVFAGVNVQTRATFSHDVKGTTPDPLYVFLEDTKSASLAVTFNYLSSWSATASYSAFWGGIGNSNQLSDRDFVSFNIKYSI
ncbi:DUF1302 domain-containing protein [Alteromonas sp. C1M14]|uniref:DUF1302 domain-containing protein n=1 Tax=Alteromonas sp. C1M14 TaxID=2841567 RepID=UPI001C080EEA|nr:DUF1302 domain-containing protein [Alteromonas sp. C1M14]MBU2976897.1 DUF1302 domain-containing protein [Alteromonas sp. C1M14]